MAWKDSRPMSPHLQIYRLPLTALLSVAHRGTGAVLSIGSLGLVAVLLAAASGESSYNAMQGFLGSWFGQLVLFGFTFSLYMHLCNGIRHLIWDAGHGYELDEVQQSAKVAIIATVALTVVTWLIAIA